MAFNRVAPQKNNISIYHAAQKEDKFLPELFKDKLGPISVGKMCVRINNINNINLDELKNLFLDTIKWDRLKRANFGRNCAKPVY